MGWPFRADILWPCWSFILFLDRFYKSLLFFPFLFNGLLFIDIGRMLCLCLAFRNLLLFLKCSISFPPLLLTLLFGHANVVNGVDKLFDVLKRLKAVLFCKLISHWLYFLLISCSCLMRERPKLLKILLVWEFFSVTKSLLLRADPGLHEAQAPVENIVWYIDTWFKGRINDELFEHGKICWVLKLHASHIIHVCKKLARTLTTQARVCHLWFVSTESSVVRRRLWSVDMLPRQTALEEIYDYVAKGNQVITARELVALVGV